MNITNRQIISTAKAPAAIGPYSQAVKTGSMVFVSGQLALVPERGELVANDIKAETRQALTNLEEILVASGSCLDNVIKTTMFIARMDNFLKINEVYSEFFTADPPARTCVEVSCLPKSANIEIEAIALLNK